MEPLKRLNEVCLHVAWQFNTTDNGGPKLERWCRDQSRIERDNVQIVMQKGTTPAMPGIARGADSRVTLAPLTGPADASAGWIGKENVSALVPALCPPLQSSPGARQCCQISIVIDGDQHIGVLRIFLISGEGADQRDSTYARANASALDEEQNLGEQEGADGQLGP
jgi:hypothetical protein